MVDSNPVIGDAQFTCLTCGAMWLAATGPMDCPHCESHHVKWVNYEAWKSRQTKEYRET